MLKLENSQYVFLQFLHTRISSCRGPYDVKNKQSRLFDMQFNNKKKPTC